MDQTKLLMVAAGAVLGLILLKKNFAVADVAAGTVGVIGDVVGGVAVGIGDVIGIPRTDETACEKAMREGRTWDASFACPAKTWLQYLVN